MKCFAPKHHIDYGYICPNTGVKYGDKRVVKKFLWFPIWLNNECRWLESAFIEERFEDDYNAWYDLFGSENRPYRWVAKQFVVEYIS